MQWGWLLLAVFAGVLIPVQAAINAKMGKCLGQPVYSTVVNFGVGILILLLIAMMMSAMRAPGNWNGAATAPWWAWIGGVLGVFFVTTSVMILPRTGAAAFTMSMLAGQIIGSLVLDHKGWLEVAQRPVTFQRLIAVFLAVGAVWLMTQSKTVTEAAP